MFSFFLGLYQNEIIDKLSRIPDYVNKVLPQRLLIKNTGNYNKHYLVIIVWWCILNSL